MYDLPDLHRKYIVFHFIFFFSGAFCPKRSGLEGIWSVGYRSVFFFVYFVAPLCTCSWVGNE